MADSLKEPSATAGWYDKDGKIMEKAKESSKEPLYEDKSNEDSLSDEEKSKLFEEMQKYG